MIKTILIVILAVAFFGLAPSGIAQTKASSKDEKAIKTLIMERIESFNNKHDAPQSAAFTQDADFVNVYGMWRKGPAEIEGRQGERMKTVLKDAKITMQDLRIRFIRPDIAIVHETHEMSRMRNEKGETMPPQQELSIRVMVKEQGKWLITAFHNTIVRPAEPAPLTFDGPKSTADQAKIEEVKRAENERLAAGVKKDIDAVSAATADEYIQIDLDGRVLAKTTMLQRIQSSYAQLRSNPVDEMVVRVYGDTAVVTGRATPQGTIGGQNVGGPVRYSRLYVKRDGRWQVVMFQQTRVAQEK